MLPYQDPITLLKEGEITVKGRFVWGSNYTFLVEVSYQEESSQAVYKPTRGERPLWDFPTASLARREAAAYVVSQSLGWDLVPPTVYRHEGPIGPGSLQLYIEHDPEYQYFNFSEEDRQCLRPIALFDLLINNADRKGSHILVDNQHHFWLIDHGICFHTEEKLRTVIWDFAGEAIPLELLESLRTFRKQLNPPSMLVLQLEELLSQREINSLARRADRLIAWGNYPDPNPNRRPYPWPPV